MINFLNDNCENHYSQKVQPSQTDAHFTNFAKSLINRLRFHATECRSAARLDIFEACKLLDPQKPPKEAEQLNIFVRTLGQATCNSTVWYKPGCDVYSFDEKWIMTVFEVYVNDDFISYNFLIRSRISMEKRKVFSLMVTSIVQILTK